MEFYEKDFGKILKANALKQRRMMLQYGTDCMRVYDRNLEQFPVTVDLYGKYARITDYSVDGMEEAMRETCCDIVSRMLYVQSDHVVFYHREKRIGREQHETLSEVSVKTLVKENGLTFTVDLTRHIDTGLFLDHAVTREWVRENCQGLSVLNLFSYTGAFSVYAAAGGAASVVSVDLSGPYTQWAKENLKANGFEGDLYPCVQMDALRFVERELAKGWTAISMSKGTTQSGSGCSMGSWCRAEGLCSPLIWGVSALMKERCTDMQSKRSRGRSQPLALPRKPAHRELGC